MGTTYRAQQRRLPAFDQPSAEARLGRLVSIAALTAMLLSFVAIYNLNADVDELVNRKIPYLKSRISELKLPIRQPAKVWQRH